MNYNDPSHYYVNIKKEALKIKVDQKTIDDKLMEYEHVVSNIEEFWEEYGKTKGENIPMY